MTKRKHNTQYPILSFLWNLGLLYMLYFLCRVVYVLEFWDMYSDGWASLSVGQLLWGGFRFDTAAIAYTCLPWALMLLLPVSPKRYNKRGWQLTAKSLYVGINTVALWANLVDTVYSRYTGRRTTATFFSEFSNEGNLGGIFLAEVVSHWYLVLLAIAMLLALVFLYRPARAYTHKGVHYWVQSISLVALLPLVVVGIRGSVTYHRPIGLSDANGYVCQPKEANIVLNTPFALIRTIGKTSFTAPAWFSQEELDSLYSPIHQVTENADLPVSQERPNVVILILESFGQEYWGFYNDGEGYTPFLDSLARHSMVWRHAYANGRKSIDALPSILSSIPMFVEPYILTPYANNEVSSVAGELSRQGYRTAFFHGADNGSMGFQAFARSVGFQDYYGMDEYCRDARFGGKDDFDGYWAIWDEEFLQYFALMLDTLQEPFLTTLFTASSHHPFRIPGRYENQFLGGDQPIYRTIQYTDHALRQFFATARRQPWYKNTLFVITADHTNNPQKAEYKTGIGQFRVPLLIYDPSGRLPVGCDTVTTAQQIDIMPTLLGFIGTRAPYLAFGQDLFNTPPDSTWGVSYYNGVYQFVHQGCLLLFDGQQPTALYHLPSDPLLQHNLLATPLGARTSSSTNSLITTPWLQTTPPDPQLLKAIIQSYMTRMIENRLTP